MTLLGKSAALRPITFTSGLALLAVSGAPALAQSGDIALPVWKAATSSIPAPANVAYPGGLLHITVDATDIAHRVFNITETVPVAHSGDMVLMVPEWLPGHHASGTDLARIAGIAFKIDGKPAKWTRDAGNVYAFHLDVPKGAKVVEARFQYLSSFDSKVGPIRMTDKMLDLQWTFASMYPAGYYARKIPIKAELTLPEGWKAASALDVESIKGQTISYKPVSYDVLIDSPAYAGVNYKQVDLDPGSSVPIRLNLFADKPEQLAITDEQIGLYRNMVKQARKVFASRHFNHYDFLGSVSSELTSNGLEHHRSTEVGMNSQFFLQWKTKWTGRDLLAHEFTHSWNGKFRRGADLWTPSYEIPMRNSLLWVYEGQTQYWGNILTARAGLYTKDQELQILASLAAAYQNTPARAWRPLIDTTNDPIIAHRSPKTWRSYQGSEDYYSEGSLIWLDIDVKLRELTGGKKSLDDFTHAFFGVMDGNWGELTYQKADLVHELAKIASFDWDGYITERIEGAAGFGRPVDPAAVMRRAGYELKFQATPTDYAKQRESAGDMISLTYSLGGTVGTKEGQISDIVWGGPFFKAGIVPGTTILAVNGAVFSGDVLRAAIGEAQTSKRPIALTIKAGGKISTIEIPYFDGQRYPYLEKIKDAPDYLGSIISEKK